MPSEHLFLYVSHPLKIVKQWAVNGCHYSKTLEVWLRRMDKNMKTIGPIIDKTYGKQNRHVARPRTARPRTARARSRHSVVHVLARVAPPRIFRSQAFAPTPACMHACSPWENFRRVVLTTRALASSGRFGRLAGGASSSLALSSLGAPLSPLALTHAAQSAACKTSAVMQIWSPGMA